MGFKKVSKGNTQKINIEEFIDKPIEGYYINTETIDTMFGESQIHKFKGKDGKDISIWGFTYLNSAMENVTQNALCRVTYKGKTKEKNKYGKYPHQALVEVDEDVVFERDVSSDIPDEETKTEPF
jgi:hypothetical protein